MIKIIQISRFIRSFLKKNLLKERVQEKSFSFEGELLPLECNPVKCKTIKIRSKKGRRKCREKKVFIVSVLTVKLPHTHLTTVSPTTGSTVTKLVITLAPQNDICPHGSTYPKNEIPIIRIRSRNPEIHLLCLEKAFK